MGKKVLPRGIRNNNPLNIRQANTWLGEVRAEEVTDPEFEQFVSMEYGIRAAVVILRRYFCRYKRKTIRQIVERWAPRSENNTLAYVNVVCKKTGWDADETIEWNEDNIVKLIGAMAYVENGQEIDVERIRKGFRLA